MNKSIKATYKQKKRLKGASPALDGRTFCLRDSIAGLWRKRNGFAIVGLHSIGQLC